MFASSEAGSLASSEALSITSFEVDVSAFSEALTERRDLLSSRFALLEIESGSVAQHLEPIKGFWRYCLPLLD